MTLARDRGDGKPRCWNRERGADFATLATRTEAITTIKHYLALGAPKA